MAVLRRKQAALVAIIAFSAIWTAPAAATPVCIPPVVGTPGNWGQPPDWTPGQPVGLRASTPFDVRWNGAASVDYGMGATSDMEFRGLYHQSSGVTYLDFSWFIKTTPDISTDPTLGETSLFVGFAQKATDVDATIIQFKLKKMSTVDSTTNQWVPQFATDGAFEVVIYTWDNGTLSFKQSISPLPSWINGTGVWVRLENEGPDLSNVAGPDGNNQRKQWAIQLHVPVDASPMNGVHIDPSLFRTWHYAQLLYTLSPSTPIANGVIPYTWPRTQSSDPKAFVYQFDSTTFQRIFPALATWGEFSTSQAGCSGIRITSDDIGTKNAYDRSYIDVLHTNTFFVKPKDVSGQAVPAQSITATFRLANWGSQVGDVTSASWTSPPQLHPPTLPSGPPVAGGEIQGNWNPDIDPDPAHMGGDRWRCMFTGRNAVRRIPGSAGCVGTPGSATCPDVPGDLNCNDATKMLHQCMLVELQGGGLQFVEKSAILNMNFATASRFEREAEVSVKGLPDLPGGKRDVYLYVEALNMPAYSIGSSAVMRRSDKSGATRTAASAAGSAAGSGSHGIPPAAPMLIVHAYHDSGATIKVENGVRRILLPQTSFAYVVEHDGPIEGWLFSTKGAEPIAGSKTHFKISVPNDGAVRISNVVEAIELKRFGFALYGGVGIPHRGFAGTNEWGPAGAVDLEYMFTPYMAALVQGGIDRFPGKSGQPTTTVLRGSANLKAYLLNGRFRIFLLGGGGVYHFDPGQTRGGAAGGGGFQVLLAHAFALEAMYLYHGIINASPTTAYSDALAGIRFRF
jgi:hypothetical protein